MVNQGEIRCVAAVRLSPTLFHHECVCCVSLSEKAGTLLKREPDVASNSSHQKELLCLKNFKTVQHTSLSVTFEIMVVNFFISQCAVL